jgi:hypothetical protein
MAKKLPSRHPCGASRGGQETPPASAFHHGSPEGDWATSVDCEVDPLVGTWYWPNPVEPVISQIRGDIYPYSSSPAIAFPLQLIGSNSAQLRPVQIQMVYTNSSGTSVGGFIQFGKGWNGPFNDITASFLGVLDPFAS